MKQKGFSLMELIIVIVIMGLLVGAMIPMFAKNTDKARVAKAQSECDAIKTAVTMYKADTGKWPMDAGATPAANTTEKGLVTDGYAVGSTWGGPYLDKAVNDPWNKAYNIAVITGKGLIVYSFGQNGTDNSGENDGTSTKDDIALTISSVYP